MSRDDRAALMAVRPSEIEALLRKHEWNVTGERPTFRTWKHSSDERRVHAPRVTEIDDYVERVDEVLRIVGAVWGFDRERVLHALEEATSDTLRLRDDRAGPKWTTTLTEGRRLLDAAHHAWMDAARAMVKFEETEAGPTKRERLDAFMSALRLGQTERGSYIVRVMAPVPPPASIARQQELQSPPPFERKVTEQMARAIRALAQATHQVESTAPRDVRDRFLIAAQQGVTSKLCDAIATAVDDAESSGVDVAISWAGTIAADPLPPSVSVRFTPEQVPVMRQGAETLRRSSVPQLPAIHGWVVRLHREQKQEGGDVVMHAHLGGGVGPRKVKLRLEESDYEIAVEAHRESRVVRCSGTLSHEGRRFELREPHHFAVVSQFEQTEFELELSKSNELDDVDSEDDDD